MANQHFTADQIIEAIRQGHTPTGAATVLHCHPDTVRAYAKRYATVKTVLDEERRNLVDLAEIGLRGALLNREAWAIAFTLRTLGRVDYSERHEVTGANGDDIVMRITVTDD